MQQQAGHGSRLGEAASPKAPTRAINSGARTRSDANRQQLQRWPISPDSTDSGWAAARADFLWARPHVLPEDLRQRYAQQRAADLLRAEHARRRRPGRAGEGLRRAWTAAAAAGAEAAAAVAVRAVSRAARRLLGRSHRSPNFRDRCVSWSRRRAPIRTLDVDLIPVSVFWGRAPDREGSWLRIAAVGELGARRALPPLAVGAGRTAAICSCSSASRFRCARAWTRARIRRARCAASRARCELVLARQRAAAIGPDLSHRRTIATQVLRAAAVRRAMAR